MVRAALLLSLLIALDGSAACIDQGHYAIVENATTLRGTPWPYSEDLASRRDQLPVGDPVIIAWEPSLRWTKIQSGCATYGERNIYASEEVNLVLRASFAFSFDTRRMAVARSRYQVQLRLNDEVVLDETRVVDGRYPQSVRFGTVVANVPRGAHVYSMWFRLLDGPVGNQVTLGLQWITSQGMPSRHPVASGRAAGEQRVPRKWIAIGAPMTIETTETSDLILLSTVAAEEPLLLGYSIAGAGKRAPREPMLISDSGFDQRLAVPPGRYTIRLWAKAMDGDARVTRADSHVAAFPTGSVAMFEFGSDEPMTVTPGGSAEDPVTLDAVCGRWTKLLDFQTPPSWGDSSWFLHAYVEFPRVTGHGYVEIAIQTVRNTPSQRLGIIEATDMGIAVGQLSPGGDAISFYGDASAWGNDGGNSMSLWIRIIEGCNDAGFGNELVVGKRWVAVKLMPTTSIHLP
jgi:hypothetical protein